MTILEITESIDSGKKTSEEKLKMLRRIRGELIEELHGISPRVWRCTGGELCHWRDSSGP